MTQPKPEKNEKSARRAPSGSIDPKQQLVAREAHTLAQMVYGQLAMTRPWILAGPTPWGASASPSATDLRRFGSPPVGGAPYFHQFR